MILIFIEYYDAKAPFYPYIFLYFITVLRRLCADEFTVKKIVGREFNKVQFSYSFSLWYSREKKIKAVVRRLPSCYFLTVSLYYTLRTINVNYLLHI